MVTLPKVFVVNDGPLMVGDGDLSRRSEEAARRYFDEAIDEVRGAPNGGRNNILNRSAFVVGQLVGGGYIGETEARSALDAAARFAAIPVREAYSTIARAVARGMAQPRDLGAEGGRRRGHGGGSRRPRAPGGGAFVTNADDELSLGDAAKRDAARRLYAAALPIADSLDAGLVKAYFTARGITTIPDQVRVLKVGIVTSAIGRTASPPAKSRTSSASRCCQVAAPSTPSASARSTKGACATRCSSSGRQSTAGLPSCATGRKTRWPRIKRLAGAASRRAAKGRFRYAAGHLHPGDVLVYVRDRDGTDGTEYESFERVCRAKCINTIALDPPDDMLLDGTPVKDVNDVLRAGGDETVRAWLQGAVASISAPPVLNDNAVLAPEHEPHNTLSPEPNGDMEEPCHGPVPAYYPVPTEPREVALVRLRQTVADFFSATTGPAVGRAEFERRRAATVKDDMEPWEKRTVTMKVRAEVCAEFGVSHLLSTGHRLFLSGGSASDASAEEVAAIRSPLSVWWLAPTLWAAEARATSYCKIASPDSLPVYVVRGRTAQDPKNRKLTMCRRADVAHKAAEAGLSVREKVCPECRYRDTCGYLRQDREIAAMGGRGVFVANHAYAFLPGCPAPLPHLVVADESMVQVAYTRLIVDPAALDAMTWLGGRLDERFPFRQVMTSMREALTGLDSLERLRATVKLGDIEAAANLEWAAMGEAGEAVDDGGGDPVIVERLDAVERRHALKVARLLRLVANEYDQPRATFNAIRFDPEYPVKERGEVKRLPRILGFIGRELSLLPEVPILHLDSTGNHGIVRKIFGTDIEHVHIPVERLGMVVGTTGKNYSRQSIIGIDAVGREMRTEEADRLSKDILAVRDALPGETVVASNKDVIGYLTCRYGLPSLSSDWFGALRGMGVLDDAASALVVGREQPSTTDIEDMARPFIADDPRPLIHADAYMKEVHRACRPAGRSCHRGGGAGHGAAQGGRAARRAGCAYQGAVG